MGLYCIIFTFPSLINTQLTLTHSPKCKVKTNNIWVKVKLKERIEITTHKGKLAGFLCKIIKISFPTTKQSKPELPLMTSIRMKPYMDQELPYLKGKCSENTTKCTERATRPTTQTTTRPSQKLIAKSRLHVCKRPHLPLSLCHLISI